MHVLSIVLSGGSGNIELLFDDDTAARKARDEVLLSRDGIVTVCDHYGTSFSIKWGEWKGLHIAHFDRQLEGRKKLAQLQAANQASMISPVMGRLSS